MSLFVTALAAGGAVALVVGGSFVAFFLLRPHADAALKRRLRRAAAPLAGTAATNTAARGEESIFRPAEERSRLADLFSWIEGRYPLVRARAAFPAVVAAGVAGGAGGWFFLWFLRIPTGWWTVPLIGLVAAGAGWYALGALQTRAEAEFVRQFPEIVDQIVRLARAGVPTLEGVAAASEDALEPVAPTLHSVRDGLLAGLDADTVLRSESDRVRIGEFTLFAAVIRLQRRAGGGVSNAFGNLSETLRERRKTAIKAHASTAQSRLTLLILAVMPALVLAVQWFVAPESVGVLFGTEDGITLLRWGVGLILAGLLVARGMAARLTR